MEKAKEKDVDFNKLINDLRKNFSIERFNKLDEKISKMIFDGKYEENLTFSLEHELAKKLDLFFNENVKKIKGTELVNFKKLCDEKNQIFHTTKSFEAYWYMTLLEDYPENEKIEFVKFAKRYINYINSDYHVCNTRQIYYLINATRIKRYKYYKKINNILKRLKQDYNLKQYENVIKQRKPLDDLEFVNFISEVNDAKIDTGLIPFNICEYLICEMLNPNSPISTNFTSWLDLRECVFGDFITHIQIKKYKVYDYLNYVKKFEKNKRGIHRKSNKTICIDEDVIGTFRNLNVRAIVTVMHELVHLEQHLSIEKNDFSGNNYRILKEDILIDNIKNFKNKNEWVLYKEIDARKKGLLRAISYLTSLEYDTNKLRIRHDYDNDYEVITLEEYKQIVLNDYEKSIEKNKELNVNKRLDKIIKNNPKIIQDKPILKYEYNDDGSKKKIEEIIIGLGKAIKNKKLSKESVKGILKYSIFDN